jgi:hypothetical protein
MPELSPILTEMEILSIPFKSSDYLGKLQKSTTLTLSITGW